ncbi:MAG: hypothetical protein JXA30_03325 [Deltaproteobacteria bacterium]|nr:hypothetical protein [Deltaproteobacteria bacterium]
MEEQQKEKTGQDSLTPITVGDVSIDEEAAALSKGKGWTIVSAVVVLAVCFVGAGMFLKSADEKSAYREAGQTLNGLKKRQFDRFWGCALESVDLRDIKSNADLMAQIENRSRAGASRYGRAVRERCVEILEEIESSLDVIQVPGELKPQVDTMKKSTSQLRDGWREYIAYISDPDVIYDETKARSYLEKIALGWYGFSKEHAVLNKILQKRLQ